jgi:pyrroloquinoline quinone (PQQ) biosynthesis protein C
MATSAEFVAQLKKDIQAFPKIRIKHPFLKAVCNGSATMDQIRAWAIQDYQFRAAVPRIAMLRYLHVDSDRRGRHLRPGGGRPGQWIHPEVQHET